MKKLIIMAMLVTTATLAQGQLSVLTNGARWMRMTKTERAAYIIGFTEGAIRPGVPATDFYECKCTTDDIEKGITEIYSRQDRRVLPVVFAWKLTAMKANGASQEAVYGEMMRLMNATLNPR